MNAVLPDAPSCERNREPILAILLETLRGDERVLEIGSGTGQHAVHFAAAMPGLHWQCSDREDNLPGIGAWLRHAALPNTPPAIALDVLGESWPEGPFDAAFTANSLHIMPWSAVEALFRELPARLTAGARLIVYGPFNYGGEFTSASNAEFDRWLKARGAHQGIRDFEAVDALARGGGLSPIADHAMPANNRCIVWEKGDGDEREHRERGRPERS